MARPDPNICSQKCGNGCPAAFASTATRCCASPSDEAIKHRTKILCLTINEVRIETLDGTGFDNGLSRCEMNSPDSCAGKLLTWPVALSTIVPVFWSDL